MSARAARTSPGLPYAAFAKPEDIVDPQIELFQPKDGDPDDYVAMRSANGARYAITNTCAANVLGYAKPGWHAQRQRRRRRGAPWQPLAQLHRHGESRRRRAPSSITPPTRSSRVVDDLIAEYGLDRDQAVLVGEGGGAAALIPHSSPGPCLDHKISRDAEVISSIGVALALVRESSSA